jgi:DinB family protein
VGAAHPDKFRRRGAVATSNPTGFEPPSFHTCDALLESGMLPTVPLSREQVEGYLDQVYARCAAFFDGLTPDTLTRESVFLGKMWTVEDRILTQLRHVQHHVGHMNGLLKRVSGSAPGWLGFNE